MPNSFTTNAVLLLGEGQGDKGDGQVEVRQGAGGGINGNITGPQSNVAEAEEVVTSAGGAGVLARSQEEVEGKGGTVRRSSESRAAISVGKLNNTAEDG